MRVCHARSLQVFWTTVNTASRRFQFRTSLSLWPMLNPTDLWGARDHKHDLAFRRWRPRCNFEHMRKERRRNRIVCIKKQQPFTIGLGQRRIGAAARQIAGQEQAGLGRDDLLRCHAERRVGTGPAQRRRSAFGIMGPAADGRDIRRRHLCEDRVDARVVRHDPTGRDFRPAATSG